MAKVTRVALATVNGGVRQEFDIDHAERILRMPRSGWVLPDDSQFEYKDGIISRRDKKKGK
jgi:hypothetical protein